MRLLHTLIVLLVGYHATNCFQHSFFVPKSHWVKAQMTVRRGPANYEIPMVSSWGKSSPYFDRVSKWIGGTGYVFRYKFGQIPDFVIHDEGKPVEFFERKEIMTLSQSESPRLIHAASLINTVMEEWKSAGAEVVFLPIPSKLSIQGMRSLPNCEVWKTCASPGGDESAEVYHAFLSRVETGVDLYSPYKELFEHGERPYLYDESHWSSRGIAEAARLVLSKIRSHQSWTVIQTGELTGSHFASEVLQLPVRFIDRVADFTTREPLFSIQEKTSQRGRVIILGTSFCERLAHTDYGLGRTLAGALGRELKEYCLSAGGLWGAVKKMKEQGIWVSKSDVVLWESPLIHIH